MRTVPDNLLFFGCRSVKADFYFREFWEDVVQQGKLTLSVAPSRDQVSWPPVSRRGRLTLTGACDRRTRSTCSTGYQSMPVSSGTMSPAAATSTSAGKSRPQISVRPSFCCSSTLMPKAVKKALLAVFQAEGKLDDDAAAEMLWEQLEKEGRIIEETWG